MVFGLMTEQNQTNTRKLASYLFWSFAVISRATHFLFKLLDSLLIVLPMITSGQEENPLPGVKKTKQKNKKTKAIGGSQVLLRPVTTWLVKKSCHLYHRIEGFLVIMQEWLLRK